MYPFENMMLAVIGYRRASVAQSVNSSRSGSSSGQFSLNDLMQYLVYADIGSELFSSGRLSWPAVFE